MNQEDSSGKQRNRVLGKRILRSLTGADPIKNSFMALFLRFKAFIVLHPACQPTPEPASTIATMETDDPILTRGELEELHSKYREMKHAINNTFAVIMAYSELGQRNPANLEKLSKAVLQRSPVVVQQLTTFGEQLGEKLKQRPAA